MSGKLPIDRVRETEDAPRVYEEHKQRYSEQQSKLEEFAASSPIDPAKGRPTSTDEVDDA